jgi:hypothetical protein
MKAGIYIFEYRSQLDHVKCWKRVECNTMDDIKNTIAMISRSYGQVVEYEKELTDEEWLKMKTEYENQEA